MSKETKGILFALLSYLLWGFLSLYWKLLSHVEAYQSFSYRIVWTLVTMSFYILISNRTKFFKSQMKTLSSSKKASFSILLAGIFISINWVTYIWAVGHGQATEASLGYYMMPLASVLLSIIFLKEKLSLAAKLSVLLAFCGVAYLVFQTGHVPFVSLILALSFSIYGLIKKNVTLSSDASMLVEAIIILPLALFYILVISKTPLSHYTFTENILLAFSGIVTAIPLLLFAEGVKRAPLNKIGFIQYINPTIQLCIAVSIFKEPFDKSSFLGFLLIWIAIFLFAIGQFLEGKSIKQNELME
ncbi:protein RarD [Streptococcus urinalis FB127-CNA-2]|uniref:Protein RarD n=1 Tax=Streptococcus urinalis 2285-97 TaxID=764291 RepID=G5KFN9_9STRE|nr:EamA family transporter RarD [Streptococcus urinalis]EHJ56687.1 protein RarD [Streptococcus urinalis 2285-97]EKS22101.1 protein RarD [Streptococcus urinalis FB127-CNA-2]VEF31913.1 chloramphenicol-sensitive protein RarD [Streptococcus urinalis]